MVEVAHEIVEERDDAAAEETAGEPAAEVTEHAEDREHVDGAERMENAGNAEESGDTEDVEPGHQELIQETRIVEALLFAATEPVSTDFLAERLPEGTDIGAILEDLQTLYTNRGVNVARVAGKWSLRTAADLSPHLRIERKVSRKPSRAAVESLAIIAYHQPVTRSEVEEIRGVSVSKGSFDVLLEAGWIKPAGRRRTPGRPTTWGTTPNFLDEFGLDSLADLPGIDELKASGLLDTRPAGTIIGDTGEIYVDAEVEGAPEEEEPEALSDEDDAINAEDADVDADAAAYADGQEAAEIDASEDAPEADAEDADAEEAGVAEEEDDGALEAFAEMEQEAEFDAQSSDDDEAEPEEVPDTSRG
jgi:segregation and condensation protein B